MKALRLILGWIGGLFDRKNVIVPSVSSVASDGKLSNVYLASEGGLASYTVPAANSTMTVVDSVLVVYPSAQSATVTLSVVGKNLATGILIEVTAASPASSFYFADVNKSLAPSETLIVGSSITGVEFDATVGVEV